MWDPHDFRKARTNQIRLVRVKLYLFRVGQVLAVFCTHTSFQGFITLAKHREFPREAKVEIMRSKDCESSVER